MRRKLLLRLGGAATLCAAGMLAVSGRASAETPATVASGWWNTANAGPVTAPSTASNGQLQVSSGVQGPLAYSAISIGLPADIDPATATVNLTLVEVTSPAGSSTAVGTVAVSACPTTSAWTPGDDQSSGAPAYNCSGSQADATNSDGQDTFSIPAGWASGSTIQVAIVPTPGTTAPFSVNFQAPTVQSASVSGAPPASASQPPATVASQDQQQQQSAAPPAAPSSPPPSDASAAAVPPVGSAVEPVISSAPTPAASEQPVSISPSVAATPAPVSSPAGGPPSPTTTVPTQPAATQSAPLVSASGPIGPGRSGRIAALAVLLLLALVMFGLSGYPVRGQRAALGAAGGQPPARLGGIGRFTKARTGPPRRL